MTEIKRGNSARKINQFKAPVILLISLILLSACASAPVHIVDTNRIKSMKDKVFRVSSIEVPCCVEHTIIVGGTLLKEKQLAMLDKIQPDEIMKVLKDEYGLNVATTNELETKSDAIHFMALFSAARGRCFFKKSNSTESSNDIVDIAYSTSESCSLGSGCTASLKYKVAVKSDGQILMRHEDEISSFKFRSMMGDSEIDQIVSSADNIPTALRRDIAKAGKNSNK